MTNRRVVLGVAGALVGAVVVTGCTSDADVESSDAPPTTVAVSVAPTPPTAEESEPEESEPSVTLIEYLSQSGIGRTPLFWGAETGPVVEFDLPDGWSVGDVETFPQAYFAAVGTEWAFETDPGPLPTAVLTIQRLDRQVDAEELLEYAPGALENLPEFEIALDDDENTVSGFPSYALSGEFVDEEFGYMAVVERTAVAEIDDATYVVQLRVTTLSRDAEAVTDAVQEIDSTLRIEPRPSPEDNPGEGEPGEGE
ncbi:LpqN/LpqT family lipoprotein [Hoyosella rhizosphaerae]|uniref:Lipoprotein LpqN n=1 Tax=Hoyosella rhizosphaerae TaxID=1755582 RepID=A0A916UDW8_9ACTN|nr:LpqN/LpqT family lipoprotein [Hoyosella rhizosphaerae]MBN4925853.1 LpqN/LpqT family lipoprotein [Hoyosella rhizosphaerae]GGC67445.1 hypothetical protein GCM10011410_20160 [Hoyosella rhizosphaerae]